MLHFFARRMRQVREEEKGFTLIELLVVVIIIGILAAIAIPTFLNQRRNAWEAQTKSDLRNSVTNAESVATQNNGSYSTVATANVAVNGSNKNSAITATNVSATDYCITGTNNTDNTVAFNYLKSRDTIVAGTACTTP